MEAEGDGCCGGCGNFRRGLVPALADGVETGGLVSQCRDDGVVRIVFRDGSLPSCAFCGYRFCGSAWSLAFS